MATINPDPCSCPRNKRSQCSHKQWLVTWREPGGRVGRQRELKFKKKEDAEAFATKVERDKDLGVYIDPRHGKKPFGEVWGQWAGAGELAESTRINYDSVYRNHYKDWFGAKPIGSITPSHIAEWEAWQRATYSPYGVQVRANVLSSVFNWAVDAEFIGRNPCRKANPRKKVTKSAYRPVRDDEIPTTAEVLGIIAEMPKYIRAAAWAMAGSGTRPGESLAISNESIDWDESVLLVNRQVVQRGLTGLVRHTRNVKAGTKHRTADESRRTPIPGILLDTFRDHCAGFPPWGEEGWFFESRVRALAHPSYQGFRVTFGNAVAAAGVSQNFPPKSFRHYFVAQALHAGIPVYEVAQWLGHRDTRTTETVYGHLVEGAFKRGGDAIGERLAGDLANFRGKIRPLTPTQRDDNEGEDL
jgi:integrase